MLMPEHSSESSSVQIQGDCLVIASPGDIAEACFSVPAIRAIGHEKKDITLTIVTPESIAPLWATLREIDHIISYPDSASHRKIITSLKQSGIQFDTSIAWEDSPAAAAFAKLGIRQRLGPHHPDLAKWLTDPVDNSQEVGPIKHRVQHYLLMVEGLNIPAFIPESFQEPARPPCPKKPRIVIVPGSDFGPSAEWPLERFAIIGQTIIDHGSHDLYILPSPNRPAPAKELIEQLSQEANFFDGELAKTLEFLRTCEVVIANDGSVPHMAAHVGTKCIVLFGPNEPEWKRPLGKMHHILREQVPCSPCLLDKCPLDHRCLEDINTDDVLSALEPLENYSKVSMTTA